jgi:hypothetical protein
MSDDRENERKRRVSNAAARASKSAARVAASGAGASPGPPFGGAGEITTPPLPDGDITDGSGTLIVTPQEQPPHPSPALHSSVIDGSWVSDDRTAVDIAADLNRLTATAAPSSSIAGASVQAIEGQIMPAQALINVTGGNGVNLGSTSGISTPIEPPVITAPPETQTVTTDAAFVLETAAAVDTADAEVVPPPPPPQGVGPHFEIGDAGVITLAPPEALDRQGNNVRRLRSLHPKLCDLSRELVRYLSAGNMPHRHLCDRAEGYRQIIDHDLDTIDFSLLYVEGVRLANARAAAAAEMTSGELPPLDEPVRERLDTLLQLHGTFMLSTVEGIEAMAAEERYQRRPNEERAYREAAIEVAASLQNEPDIIEASAAAVVVAAAEQIGEGANPERSGVVGTGTLRNVTISLTVAAAVAALPIVGGLVLGSEGLVAGGGTALLFNECLKRSKTFGRVIAPITGVIDAAAEADLAKVLPELKRRLDPQLAFVRSLEPKLRVLAARNEQFSWINGILDRLKGPSADS